MSSLWVLADFSNISYANVMKSGSFCTNINKMVKKPNNARNTKVFIV